uniref:C2H2-type domain-containing protein n=1 Tax=Panagrolaimus davidi TaxID=227884 RepID=A0A914P731_9BILA
MFCTPNLLNFAFFKLLNCILNFDLTDPIIDLTNGHFGSLSNHLLCYSLVPKDTIFDTFCPSVKKDLKERTYVDCGKYFATKKAKLDHQKSHVCTTNDDYLLESESEEKLTDEQREEEIADDSRGLPIVDPSNDPYTYINVFENLTI